MAIKVSVLIPVYNTAAYLEKCLDSVLGQTYSDLEVIAVNDGSTDNSGEILERYARRHGNLRVVMQDNGGLQKARQAAIQCSTGDFIAFVDSDDSLPANDVISSMVQAVQPDTQLVVGRMNLDRQGNLRMFPSAIFQSVSAYEYLTRYVLCGRVSWNLVAKLFDRHLVVAVTNNPIRVSAGEDALYTIALMHQAVGTVEMVNFPVYNYYMREGSITQSKKPKYILDNFRVADYVDNLLDGVVEKKYRVAFRMLCMSNSFRYGWLGSLHPLNAETIRLYKETPGVMSLFSVRKRIKLWVLIHCGDWLSRYVYKNQLHEN